MVNDARANMSYMLSMLICRFIGLMDPSSPSSLGPKPLSVPARPASPSMSQSSSSFSSSMTSIPASELRCQLFCTAPRVFQRRARWTLWNHSPLPDTTVGNGYWLASTVT